VGQRTSFIALVRGLVVAFIAAALAALAATPANADVPAPIASTASTATVSAEVGLVANATPVATQAAEPVRVLAMKEAQTHLGDPYQYGAAGPTKFDCSGLVYASYKKFGVTLPRTSRSQSTVGVGVAEANIEPGDLVFYYFPVSHVAIYIGDDMVLMAPSSGGVVNQKQHLHYGAINVIRRV
jgi:cell wall-associated NlpC family hydrolase